MLGAGCWMLRGERLTTEGTETHREGEGKRPRAPIRNGGELGRIGEMDGYGWLSILILIVILIVIEKMAEEWWI